METWQMFAVAGLVLAAAELFTPTFFTLPAGIAFFITAAVAGFTDDLVVLYGTLGVLLFVIYGIMYIYVWPRLQKTIPKSNASAMAGKVATVTEAVDPTTGAGEVKLYGDLWRVVAEQAFATGTRVKIVDTDGNKVVIAAIDGDEA